MPYSYAEFERNGSTGRMSVWLKATFVKRYEEEEKGEENEIVFRNIYLMNYWADLCQIWYVWSHI